jgi:hypothetical protein
MNTLVFALGTPGKSSNSLDVHEIVKTGKVGKEAERKGTELERAPPR